VWSVSHFVLFAKKCFGLVLYGYEIPMIYSPRVLVVRDESHAQGDIGAGKGGVIIECLVFEECHVSSTLKVTWKKNHIVMLNKASEKIFETGSKNFT
jgi:hypothetical protein